MDDSLQITFSVMKIERERATNINQKNKIKNEIKKLKKRLMKLENREEELNEILYRYLQMKK